METRSKRTRVRWLGLPLTILIVAASCSLNSDDETDAFSVSLPTTTAAPATPNTVPADISSTTSSAEPDTPGPVLIMPNDDANEIVSRSPQGTTFELASGTHRGFSVDPKDEMTFSGLDGAVLSGAIELSGPVEIEGGWRFDGIEFTGIDHGSCVGDYEGCGLSQDLFFDDVMMWQVTDPAELETGAWYWEGTSIYVVDNPNNRNVELSVEEHAFSGDSDDVTIRNILVEKYATPAQSGAIQAQDRGGGDPGTGWLIEDVEVRGAHGVGIRIAAEAVIRRVYLHHNGQLGIAVSGGTDVLIEDSEFSYNNTAGFSSGWESGGSKFTRTDGLVVRRTFSHNNNGPGLWTDIDNVDTLYESNRIVDNTGVGIYHEISTSATIRGNHVEGNGFGFSSWLWGAGILIAASSDVEVVGNTVINNANAIAGIQQDRGDGAFGPRILSNLNVHDNTITMGTGRIGIVEDVGDPSVFTDLDNRFDFNTYQDDGGRSYFWGGKATDRAGWMDAGQDVNGTWQ